MPRLNETENSKCNGLLTEYECGLTIKQMKNNKSPGSNGISIEFYKIFWNSIKTYLVNSLNYSFENQNLTELQKQSIITLLPKPGKDTSLLDNWRPISLLNVDYKIATKSIANRLKDILPSIIHSSQTGFLKNRYIGENIRLLFEVLDDVEKFNKPALLFFSDFEKAFDSVNHNFIFKCLNHFNFGESFINWIRLFYNDSKSCIINNGFLSDFFPIERGVRQGCPISPYLFIICIELLSHEILSNNNIKGITVDGYEIKNTLFADDATFLTDGSKESFTTLIDILDNFTNISGLKLNSSKCTVLRSGSLKQSNVKYCPTKKFKWSSDCVKALGIYFYNDNTKNLTSNLNPKLEEFQNCLKSWMHRKLTLLGKITVIKCFALPKLVYPFTVLNNPPQQTVQFLKKIMFNFLWDKKPDKIKRDIITQDYKDGGLKMIDIEMFLNSLKSSWRKRILDTSNNGIWNYT